MEKNTQSLKPKEDLDRIEAIRKEVNRFFDEIINIGQTEIPINPDVQSSTLEQLQANYDIVKPHLDKLNSVVYNLAIEVNSARSFLLKHTGISQSEITQKEQSWQKH